MDVIICRVSNFLIYLDVFCNFIIKFNDLQICLLPHYVKFM